MTADDGRHPEGERSPSECQFLFGMQPIGSPLEELRRTLEKKLQRCESLGETQSAEVFRRAYELARAKLAARVGDPSATEQKL